MNAKIAYELHASLFLSARQRARDFAAQAKSIYCDSEQAEMARDFAHDARRDAWAHLHAAKRAKHLAGFEAAGFSIGQHASTT